MPRMLISDHEAPEQGAVDVELEELISQIIINLAQIYMGARTEPSSNCSSERIIFDFSHQGERYVLLKIACIDHKLKQLSARESEIVQLVARGFQNKSIAGRLGISSWTVCTHLRRIFAKLGVTSRAAMVAEFVEFSGGEKPYDGVEHTSGERRSKSPARDSAAPDFVRPGRAESGVCPSGLTPNPKPARCKRKDL